MSIYVLHHNDTDGYGAAYAAWKKFGDGAKVLINTLSGLYELQVFALVRSFWVWLLLPMTLARQLIVFNYKIDGKIRCSVA